MVAVTLHLSPEIDKLARKYKIYVHFSPLVIINAINFTPPHKDLAVIKQKLVPIHIIIKMLDNAL